MKEKMDEYKPTTPPSGPILTPTEAQRLLDSLRTVAEKTPPFSMDALSLSERALMRGGELWNELQTEQPQQAHEMNVLLDAYLKGPKYLVETAMDTGLSQMAREDAVAMLRDWEREYKDGSATKALQSINANHNIPDFLREATKQAILTLFIKMPPHVEVPVRSSDATGALSVSHDSDPVSTFNNLKGTFRYTGEIPLWTMHTRRDVSVAALRRTAQEVFWRDTVFRNLLVRIEEGVLRLDITLIDEAFVGLPLILQLMLDDKLLWNRTHRFITAGVSSRETYLIASDEGLHDGSEVTLIIERVAAAT